MSREKISADSVPPSDDGSNTTPTGVKKRDASRPELVELTQLVAEKPSSVGPITRIIRTHAEAEVTFQRQRLALWILGAGMLALSAGVVIVCFSPVAPFFAALACFLAALFLLAAAVVLASGQKITVQGASLLLKRGSDGISSLPGSGADEHDSVKPP